MKDCCRVKEQRKKGRNKGMKEEEERKRGEGNGIEKKGREKQGGRKGGRKKGKKKEKIFPCGYNRSRCSSEKESSRIF